MTDPDSTLTIRTLQPGDIPDVSALALRIWHKHYVPDIVTAEQIEYMRPLMLSEESFARILEDEKHRVWLLCDAGTITGYITLTDEAKGCWFIDKLYVEGQRQHGGLGSMLLDYCISQLQPQKMILRVNRKNYKAVNFYFKHGFTITGTDEKDIGGGFVMDDFIMEKTL